MDPDALRVGVERELAGRERFRKRRGPRRASVELVGLGFIVCTILVYSWSAHGPPRPTPAQQTTNPLSLQELPATQKSKISQEEPPKQRGLSMRSGVPTDEGVAKRATEAEQTRKSSPSSTTTTAAPSSTTSSALDRNLEKLVDGMIQAGFSREVSRAALRAVGAKGPKDVPAAISWELKRGKDKGLEEFHAERTVLRWEHMDFDGYAVGKAHVQAADECGQRCLAHKPRPPSNYVCNVWVWCGHKPKCFAPAAGDFPFGQCWLKHQDHPNRPQVNMRGNYSAQYRSTHRTAPAAVAWTAGVVVRQGTSVDLSTWSARANW